jgi:hypothetical protein
MIDVNAEELVQITERHLADAEEAYRRNPSDANQRRIMSAWTAVRRAWEHAREARHAEESPTAPNE